jgi:DNA-binding transcriptional LysR family regulator
LGSFPEVSLADARAKRDDAQKLLATGVNPSDQKKQDKLVAEVAASNTFGAIAEERLQQLKDSGMSEATLAKNAWIMRQLASPLTKRPIAEITAAEILVLLKKYEASGMRESAKRLRGVIGSVFRLAVATLRAQTDPTYALRGAIAAPVVTHSRLAQFKPNIFIESYTPQTLLALAEAGHGVAVIPSQLQTRDYRLRIVALTYRGRPLRAPMVILWDKQRSAALCRGLLRNAGGLYPGDFPDYSSLQVLRQPPSPI